MSQLTHVKGKKDKGHIVLYAISTCVWCRRAKRFLKENDVDHYYIDVDLLGLDEKVEVKEEVRRWNPKVSYPTFVIDNERSVVGFDEDELKEAIGL